MVPKDRLHALPGDALDAGFCARACEGAQAVYHCMNPPYDAAAWAEIVPRLMDNLIAAAGGAGARLVVLDNLYMLGRPNGRPMNEDTPVNPCSRKGEIRARAAERLLDAHRKGQVVAVAGRASDFYGPRGTLTYLGDFFWKRALAGKEVWLPVDPDAVHTYHYIPDVAAGLAQLGCAHHDALGRAWMLPCQPAETLRELVERMERVSGRKLSIARLSPWIVKLSAPFFPLEPIVLCAMCVYMLYSAVDYARGLSLLGIVPLVVGVPLYVVNRLVTKAAPAAGAKE